MNLHSVENHNVSRSREEGGSVDPIYCKALSRLHIAILGCDGSLSVRKARGSSHSADMWTFGFSLFNGIRCSGMVFPRRPDYTSQTFRR